MAFSRYLRVSGQVTADVLKDHDRLEEREALDSHDEIDGVEVLATPETAREVGARVRCRVELAADRTEEAEIAVALLPRDAQAPGELGDVDVVAKSTQFRFPYPSGHTRASGFGAAVLRASTGRPFLEELEIELLVDHGKLSFAGGHEEFAGHRHQHAVVPCGMVDEDLLEVLGE